MNKKRQELIRFSTILPEELEIEIHRAEEGGFWAQVKNFPGCLTQGENFWDLIEMINDAVLTYFEVPAPLRKELGIYVPKLSDKIKDEILHEKIEKSVTGIIRNRQILEFSRV